MSNYENRTLLGYVPDVLKPVREYQALTLGEQHEIYKVFDEIQGILDNLFLETATEYGVGRWEKLLNIIPNPAAETLPFRRERILSLLRTFLPFTERWLEQKIAGMFPGGDAAVSVDHGGCRINVAVRQSGESLWDELRAMLRGVVPANMLCVLGLALETGPFAGVRLNTSVTARTVFDLTQPL